MIRSSLPPSRAADESAPLCAGRAGRAGRALRFALAGARGRGVGAERGFTLIELTVSLAAGLIVAMAVVGLSREATTSFNEEIRTASAEAAARTAMDRLRADLQRASFMSTGNIMRDPKIAVIPGTANVGNVARAAFPGLARLAGVHLLSGGSATKTPLSAAQNVAPPGGSTAVKLNPDAIEIGGNFTSNDQFVVRNVDPPAGACQTVWLSTDSPPIYAIMATGASAAKNFQNAFQPVLSPPSGGGAPPPNYQYLARISDDTGHFQYVVTCPVATGGMVTTPPSPFISISITTPILTTQQTGTTGGAGGLGVGRLTINPVQVVRWEITNAPPAALSGALNAGGDPNKYDLVRSFVDATGNVVPESTEVVGEYAVDLKFAFTADSSTDTTGASATVPPTLLINQFDDDTTNATWAPDVSTMVAGPYTVGPQRIRSVSVRLVTRASISDRDQNIAPNPANPGTPNGNSEAFIMRYCAGLMSLDDAGAAQLPDCTKIPQSWARTRTFTTEVALPNQSRMSFL